MNEQECLNMSLAGMTDHKRRKASWYLILFSILLLMGLMVLGVGLRLPMMQRISPILEAGGVSEEEREQTVYYLLKSEVGNRPTLKSGEGESELKNIFNWQHLNEDQLQQRLYEIKDGTFFIKVQTVTIDEGYVGSHEQDLKLTYQNGGLLSIQKGTRLPNTSSDFQEPFMQLVYGCEVASCDPVEVEVLVGKEKVRVPYVDADDLKSYLSKVDQKLFPLQMRVLRDKKEVGRVKVKISAHGFLMTEIE